MKETIKLENVECTNNKIIYYFSSSLNLFKKDNFFIEYDSPIHKDRTDINTIPFAAAMVPIGLASGSNLVIPYLDPAYCETLNKTRSFFKNWFPKWSFDCQIFTHSNHPQSHSLAECGSKSGLLFSGGLDSLTSYIHRKEEKPVLYTIIGADIPLENKNFISLCKNNWNEFARSQGVEIRYIHSNIRDIFDQELLKKYSHNWYGEVAHGLLLTSLVAPQGFKTLKNLYLASCTHFHNCATPCGSSSDLLEDLKMGNTTVCVDNTVGKRSEKIAFYFKNYTEIYPYLRVCWKQFKLLNCSQCEKCLRTICDLLLNNIDPAHCNFKVDDKTLINLKKMMLKKYYLFFRSEGMLDFWRAIQSTIDLNNLKDMYGSKDFFTWLMNFERLKEKQNPVIQTFVSTYLDFRSSLSKAKLFILEKGYRLE